VTWTGLNWLPGEGGDVPDRSVRAGEVNGKSVFIVRAKHEGATIPGKLVSGSSKAIVGYGGIEHSKSDYQVQCVVLITLRTLNYNYNIYNTNYFLNFNKRF